MKISLEGGSNFRDLCGIKSVDGRKIKRGLFIRGGNLSRLTDRDVAFFSEKYDVASVIDLRTETEAEELPDREIPGAVNVKNPLFSGATAGISHERGASVEDIVRINRTRKDLFSALPYMGDLYKYIFSDEYAVKMLAQEINIIIDNTLSGRATIYHCTKGKDRTGVTTLIILSMLGVPKRAIYRDYLLTNRVCLPEAVKYWLAIAVFRLDFPSAGKIFDCVAARRKFLRAVYKTADEKYGSMENFISRGLLIASERIAAFKQAALE